jgi:hypothetical protein
MHVSNTSRANSLARVADVADKPKLSGPAATTVSAVVRVTTSGRKSSE